MERRSLHTHFTQLQNPTCRHSGLISLAPKRLWLVIMGPSSAYQATGTDNRIRKERAEHTEKSKQEQGKSSTSSDQASDACTIWSPCLWNTINRHYFLAPGSVRRSLPVVDKRRLIYTSVLVPPSSVVPTQISNFLVPCSSQCYMKLSTTPYYKVIASLLWTWDGPRSCTLSLLHWIRLPVRTSHSNTIDSYSMYLCEQTTQH